MLTAEVLCVAVCASYINAFLLESHHHHTERVHLIALTRNHTITRDHAGHTRTYGGLCARPAACARSSHFEAGCVCVCNIIVQQAYAALMLEASPLHHT